LRALVAAPSLGIGVLPVDPVTNRPTNPGRDSSLQGFAGRIPNVFLPMMLGGARAFSLPSLHKIHRVCTY